MDERTRILALAQSIYLAKNNRYNDVENEEEDLFVAQTIDWVNQWVEELEEEADWNYVRRQRALLGTVDAAVPNITLPTEVKSLVVSPYRYLVLSHDGVVVAGFRIVNPNQIGNTPPDEGLVEDRVTVVGRKLIFSRDLKETEIGADVLADVVDYIPRISLETGQENVQMLDLIKPRQLIVLGVAKNATLPDIVQGGISPSLAQKYNDLLQRAIAKNNESSSPFTADSEDFSFITGVW